MMLKFTWKVQVEAYSYVAAIVDGTKEGMPKCMQVLSITPTLIHLKILLHLYPITIHTPIHLTTYYYLIH
jgi:hypothetical protein